MRVKFSGELWFWKGPSPWHFVTVPDPICADIEALSSMVSYGWGMIPADVRIGQTTITTALWPKDGAYVVPIKASVRRAEGLDIDDVVQVELTIAQPG